MIYFVEKQTTKKDNEKSLVNANIKGMKLTDCLVKEMFVLYKKGVC